MSKRRVAIVDDDGSHIAAYYLPSDSEDLEGGSFEGLCAPGVSTLRGRSFAGSSLYWAMLEASDLSGCNFEGCDLRGANLKSARLVDANLCHANLGCNNLRSATMLQGADLTGAALTHCNLIGAVYDRETRFPASFDPKAAGMVEHAG